MKVKCLRIILSIMCFAMLPFGAQIFAADTFVGEAPTPVSDAIIEKGVQPQSASSNIVVPSSVPTKTVRTAQTFHHLHVFSFGGLMVLFFFFGALTFGPVWTFAFTILLSYWGWFTLPDSLGWLQSAQAFHAAILLGVLAFIFSFIPNVGLPGVLNVGLPGVLDVALVLSMVWIVINGVFVDTNFVGRLFLICWCAFGSIGGNIAVDNIPFPLKKLALPVGSFCCMTIISIWL